MLALAAVVGGIATCRGRGAPRPKTLPRRVVSLAPNLTEIVYAVGAGDTLVGASDYSDYPPAAQALPRVGGLEVSAERVASLHPDLILAAPEGTGRGPVAGLQASGLAVLVVPGASLDEVLAGIRLVARSLGRSENGERLAASLAARREAVRRASAGRPRPSALLLIWPDPPQAAGGGTFLDDLLREAGARNVISDRPGWPVVSAEWLSTRALDVLIVPDSVLTRDAYRAAFASGPLSRGAIARARVLRVDESILTRAGPRVFDALETLQRQLFSTRDSRPAAPGGAR